MPLPVHWVNLQPDSHLSVLDRGFAYGDGLFETLRYHRGHFHLQDPHLQRLRRGCQQLDIDYPHESLQQHFATTADYLCGRDIAEATLRLSVTRGTAQDGLQGRGYAGAHGTPNVVFSVFPCKLPWRQTPAPARLILNRHPLATQPLLAGIKHCNRLEQVLAAKVVREEGVDEAIMQNQAGQVIAAVAANLFLADGGRLYTPDLSECGVAGTVRALVLEQLAATCMIHVEQRPVGLSELYQAEEVILSNSLIGIQSVANIEDHHFTATGVADQLRSCFFDWVDRQAQ